MYVILLYHLYVGGQANLKTEHSKTEVSISSDHMETNIFYCKLCQSICTFYAYNISVLYVYAHYKLYRKHTLLVKCTHTYK